MEYLTEHFVISRFSLCQPLCALFSFSIQDETFPKFGKMWNVFPVSKLERPLQTDTDIIRISLTSTAGKQLEAIVGGWLVTFIY